MVDGETAEGKVFISYAGEDWERFVESFARRLRADGVGAWVAPWEIRPTDSLPKKIFGEGLTRADTVIIVLSEFSVSKPWVVEELDVAMVRRVEDKVRLLPIRIDDTPIPTALRPIKRVTIDDIDDYEARYQEIVAALLNIDTRPPLGRRPAYASPAPVRFQGLGTLDNHVLNLISERAYAEGTHRVWYASLIESAAALGISEYQLYQSVKMLIATHHLRGQESWGGSYQDLSLTWSQIESYARSVDETYDEQRNIIIAQILDDRSQFSRGTSGWHSARPAEPEKEHVCAVVVGTLEEQGLVKLLWPFGGQLPSISSVNPRLSQLLT